MIDSLSFFVKRHRVSLTRIGIIGGMIALLAAVGYLAVEVDPFIVLIAIIAPMGAFILLKRIELAFVAMLLSGVFVRFRLPTGTASEIVMSLLLCGGILGLWVVNMLVVDKRLALKPSPINLPLLAFMVAVFVSLGWSRAFRDVFVHEAGSPFVSVASAVVMVLLPGTSLLVANLVQSTRWLQVMVWVFLGEGLVSLIVSLILDLHLGPANTLRQLIFYNGIVWINTQGLFSLWYVSLSLTLALFNRRLH